MGNVEKVTMKDKAQCMVPNITARHIRAANSGISKKEYHMFMKFKI